MSTSQQPEALSLEEFRAKVTRAAREPLWARIAELEEQLSAIGAGGVEPLRKQAAAPQAVQAAVSVAHRKEFTDGHRTLEQDVFSAIHDYAATKPEQDPDDPESWESWFEAAFDLLGTRVGQIFEEHAERSAPAHPAEGVPAQAAASTDQSRAQFDAWIRTHEEEHGAVDEASAWAAWSACSLMQVTNTTMHGLEQFIEQMEDVRFLRCRIGSKEGAIRWDIEFGHYGAEVRGKTLRDAITKAIAAQAKQGGEE